MSVRPSGHDKSSFRISPREGGAIGSPLGKSGSSGKTIPNPRSGKTGKDSYGVGKAKRSPPLGELDSGVASLSIEDPTIPPNLESSNSDLRNHMPSQSRGNHLKTTHHPIDSGKSHTLDPRELKSHSNEVGPHSRSSTLPNKPRTKAGLLNFLSFQNLKVLAKRHK